MEWVCDGSKHTVIIGPELGSAIFFISHTLNGFPAQERTMFSVRNSVFEESKSLAELDSGREKVTRSIAYLWPTN